jgi:hypothetical protein
VVPPRTFPATDADGQDQRPWSPGAPRERLDWAALRLPLGVIARRGLLLPMVLAGADIVGEFVAQETVAITITVSFVVAVAILMLSAHAVRRLPTKHRPAT